MALTWLTAVRHFWRQGIWEVEPQRLGRWGRFWLRQGQVAAVVVREFFADQCLLRASALTFTTLLSFVPLLAIMFALLKGFGAEIDVEVFILDRVALGSQEMVDAIFTYISNSNLARLGAVGVISLVVTVVMLLSNIEKSFNNIWGVRETRSLYRRFADYFSVVSLGPLLILAAVSMTTSITSQALLGRLLESSLVGPLLHELFKFIPFVLMWAAFACLYLFMPNAKVSVRAALVGGIFGGTAWQLLQWGYVTFQFGVARNNAIYGTMAALPTFMVWIYCSWVIVLLGLEVTFAWQNLRSLRQELSGDEVNADGRERAALGVLLVLAEAFCRGEGAQTHEDVVARSDIPARLVRDLVSQLQRLGLLVEVVTPANAPAAFQLARAPETMRLDALFNGLRRDGAELPRGGHGIRVVERLCGALDMAREKALAGRTLRDLVAEVGNNDG